ncbi:hypothetical protein SASPL_147275 [Salvia splendens]|uniref:Myb/SANT-like domain-containing protein n=1 Tax=Salvia splendens TaxID=180675 RepID=A0A8X8WDE7_SALSN|nr:hypothetical protein SASPL_147275 [Salvia splendens]
MGLKSDNGFQGGYLKWIEASLRNVFPTTDLKGLTYNCDGDKWDQIVKLDSNVKTMRGKSWPFLEDWKEVFGNDMATGGSSEGVKLATRESMQDPIPVGTLLIWDWTMITMLSLMSLSQWKKSSCRDRLVEARRLRAAQLKQHSS